MNDPVETAAQIQKKIAELESFRQRLNKFVKDKELSHASLNYEKAKEISTLKYKAEGHPVSIIGDLVKGDCANKKADLVQAEIKYKAILTNIQIIQSQLNGFQSINKHLAVS